MDNLFPNWTLIAQLIMFLAAMGILSRLLFKPMLQVFAKRATLTDQPYEDAAKLEKDAATAEQAVGEKLAQIRQDTDALRQELVTQASHEERDALTGAREEANKIADAAREELAAAVTDAQWALAAESDELAEALANKLLEIKR